MERRSACLRLAAAFILGIVAVAGVQPLPVPTSAAAGDRLAAASLPAGVSVGAIACPAITWCLAVGVVDVPHGLGGLIAKTINGGKSWTVQHRDENRQLVGIACPGTTRCYIVGTYSAA